MIEVLKKDITFDQPASPETGKPTIVFVHHLGGNKTTLRRHAEFFNNLGYTTARYNLKSAQGYWQKSLLLKLAKNPKFLAENKITNIQDLWAYEVEQLLGLIEGPKVVYSFSLPGFSALAAISSIRAENIIGWIADSGPFFDLLKSTWNLLTKQYTVNNFALRALSSALGFGLYGGFGLESETRKNFSRLPENFPILSIRGWQDPLVPPSSIEKVFSLPEVARLNLQVLDLPEAQHLDGLKNATESYTPRVTSFIRSIT